MKYRKKPVVIEAYVITDHADIPEWFTKAVLDGTVIIDEDDGSAIIKTLEGDMKANPGDYIIKGVKGELYPCKPDIFLDTYEELEEAW